MPFDLYEAMSIGLYLFVRVFEDKCIKDKRINKFQCFMSTTWRKKVLLPKFIKIIEMLSKELNIM